MPIYCRGLLKVLRGRSRVRTDSTRSVSPMRQDLSNEPKEPKEPKESSGLRRQITGRSKPSPRDSLDESRTPVPSAEPDFDRPLDPVLSRQRSSHSDPSTPVVPVITMSAPAEEADSLDSVQLSPPSRARAPPSPIPEEEDPVLTSAYLDPEPTPLSPVSQGSDLMLASPSTRRRRKLPTPGLSPRSSRTSSLASSPAGSLSELNLTPSSDEVTNHQPLESALAAAHTSSLESAAAGPTLHALASAFHTDAYDPITRLQQDPISESGSPGRFNRNKASQQSSGRYQARAAVFARRSSEDEDDSSVGTYSRRGSLLSAFSSDPDSPMGPGSLASSRRGSMDGSLRSDGSSSSLLRQSNLASSGDELESLSSIDEAERTRL